MRPRSFDRGNDYVTFVLRGRRDASMRPRSFDRGNSALFNYSIFKDLAAYSRAALTHSPVRGVIRPLGSGAPY